MNYAESSMTDLIAGVVWANDTVDMQEETTTKTDAKDISGWV